METVDGYLSEKLAPLAIPEEDDSSIDTQFIHWGYVNCCQTVSNGKKVKKESWNTFWLELCGSTLRFYRDSSLPANSNICIPPSSPCYILEENETKGAFFALKNADVKVLSNGKFSHSFPKKSKKSINSKVIRRHLFQLKLHQIHSNYVFQAPSRSSMLRWVSKIQESLDAYELSEKSESAEQRLRLARDLLRKNAKSMEEVIDDVVDGIIDSNINATDSGKNNYPNLRNLKNRLSMKREQLWQFEMQIIDFLGRGKGQFKPSEFVCVLKQDYLLVPGQLETFVPAGTNITIFGQLPNRRWRCLVERHEVLKSMNILINNIGNMDKCDDSCRDKTLLKNLVNNNPDYPLIGCLPTSVLNFEVDKQTYEKENLSISIGENIDIKLSECLTDSDVESTESQRNSDICISDLKADSYSGSGNTSEADDSSDISDTVQLRAKGAGIIIKKKLRQKGISIIVGSSSSEGEFEDENDM